MLDVKTRYGTAYRDFDALLEYAVALIEAQAGRKSRGNRDLWRAHLQQTGLPRFVSETLVALSRSNAT
jgi:hypothetical protein